jgi:hypothetical protein
MKFDWTVMPGLDPGIHAELPRRESPYATTADLPHGLPDQVRQ